jgi:prepilin-type N-terminal cleavage/methylation domain-containing protein
MWMVDKKGMTLTELLASIVILTTAVILMYGLMSNIQKKKNDVNSRTSSMVIIADIEKSLQGDIMGIPAINYGKKTPKSVAIKNITDGKQIVIKASDDTTYTNNLTVKISNKDTIIEYNRTKGATKKERKWVIKDKKCTMDDISKYRGDTSSYLYSNTWIYIVIKCVDNRTSEYEYIKVPIRTATKVTRT